MRWGALAIAGRRPRGRPRAGRRAASRSDVVARRGRRRLESLVGIPKRTRRPSGRVPGPRRRSPDRLALLLGRADEPVQHHLRRVHRDVRRDAGAQDGPGRSPASRSSPSLPCSSFTSRASTCGHAGHGAGFQTHLYGMFIALVLAVALITYFVSQLSLELRRRERALAEAEERTHRWGKLASIATWRPARRTSSGLRLERSRWLPRRCSGRREGPGRRRARRRRRADS